MDSYLSHAQNLLSSAQSAHSSSASFSELLVLSENTHATLQNDLKRRRESDCSSDAILKRLRSSTGVLSDEALRNRVAQVIEAFFSYVSQHPPIQVFTTPRSNRGGAPPPPPPSLPLQAWISAHQSYAHLFSRCSTLFVHPSSPASFQSAFRSISSSFLTLSIRTDLLSHPGVGGGKWERLTDCTSRLAGPVRAAGMDRSGSAGMEGRETKRAAVMWLGNDCLRGYFKLNNLKLCETVIKSIQEALSRNSSTEGAGESIYPKSDRVRYRYYLGRVRLSQGRVRVAYEHLSWALENCYCPSETFASSSSSVSSFESMGGPTRSPPPQVRRILLHLLPTVLCLGLRPSPALSQLLAAHYPDLVQLYGPLFEAVARPSLGDFDVLLAQRERKEYLRRLGVWLLVREKATIGIWRGIVRRCLLLSLPPTFATSSAPPTLSISQIHRALPFFLSPTPTNAATSTQGSTATAPALAYSQLDVECILASLVDQGYIKGYTFHSKGLVVFQKGDRMGFAPVSAVY